MSVEGPTLEPQNVNLYNQIVAKTREQHRLFSVHWELTYRCNERCTHCYLDVFPANAPVAEELSTQECLQIIDQIAAAGVMNLTFSGGEILVRRDFFDIAEYAHTKRFLLRLFTNGILINTAVADRIAALHPYAVEISIYGARAETHEKITQVPRSFELSTRALRLLHERGVRTVMKTPLMRENVRDFHMLKSLVQEWEIQFRYGITITPQDNGSLSPLHHRLEYDDLLWLFRQDSDSEVWAKRSVTSDQRTCGIGMNALVIDPYGHVFPCVQTRIAAGNLREQSLQDIWTTSPVWEEFGNLVLDKLPVCRTCELHSLCVRCHGLARLEDGDLCGPALVNCHQAMARRQVLVEKGVLPDNYPIPAHLQGHPEQVYSEPSQQSE